MAEGFQGQNEKCKFLTATLTNIFHNFILHKTKKNELQNVQMDELMIISSLKERKKLAKIFDKNPLDYSKSCLFSQANKCTNLILQSKTDNIAKMSAKLDDPNLTPQTYWSTVSRFLNKNYQQHYLFLLTVNSYLTFK